jgi:hypothetical protein
VWIAAVACKQSYVIYSSVAQLVCHSSPSKHLPVTARDCASNGHERWCWQERLQQGQQQQQRHQTRAVLASSVTASSNSKANQQAAVTEHCQQR